MYDYVSHFYNEQNFYPTGGIPSAAVTVIEEENLYLRIAYSVTGTMNCDVFYPNRTTEVLILDSSMYSPNHWGTNGKFS
jgi:hypothetical protein